MLTFHEAPSIRRHENIASEDPFSLLHRTEALKRMMMTFVNSSPFAVLHGDIGSAISNTLPLFPELKSLFSDILLSIIVNNVGLKS